jgi:predicted HTH transcriptional regulator
MAISFEKVRSQAESESVKGGRDQTKLLRNLDARQRKALALFRRSREITAKEVGALFGFQPRTASLLCRRWVESGFLEATDPARKSRRYRLNDVYEAMLDNEN